METATHAHKRATFEALYREHQLSVLAYCTRRCSIDLAADACAETFLVAWRRLDEVPAPPATLPYLYGVARMVLRNQARSTRRHTRLDARLRNLGLAPPADPVAIVVQSDADRQVVAAVRHLRPLDREILRLFAWEDLSRDTIAEMMGMTRAAVDQRIHRSFKRLRRSLRPLLAQIDSPPIAEEGAT